MSGETEPDGAPAAASWKPKGSVLGLGLLIASMFGIAAALQADRSSPTLDDSPDAAGIHGVSAEPPPAVAVVPSAAPESPAPASERLANPEPSDAGAPIEVRAENDRERALAQPDRWTVQWLVACDPANVARAIAGLETDTEVLVLPASVGGRTCWRVCGGLFEDRAAAEQAASHGTSQNERPVPRRLADLVP